MRAPAIVSRLTELESEHTRLTDAWADLPTPMAKEKAGRQLMTLENEIKESQIKMKDAEAQWREALKICMELCDQWEAARHALETDASARRRADGVRSVVKEIRLTFKPTGKKYPTSELMKIEMVPNLEYPDGRESSRGRGLPGSCWR